MPALSSLSLALATSAALQRGRAQRSGRRRQLPPVSATSLFAASDFELLRELGEVRVLTSESRSRTTLSWTVSDSDSPVPDALAVSRSLGGEAAAAAGSVVRLYAARALAPPYARCLLKEHRGDAQRLAQREVAAYAALAARLPPELSADAVSLLPPDTPASPAAPVAPLAGYFLASTPGTEDADVDDDRPPSLFLVQRWVPLTTLGDFMRSAAPSASASAAAAAAARAAPPPFDPFSLFPLPFQRVPLPAPPPRTALQRRRCYVASVAALSLSALARLHSCRIAHGALDDSCLLLSGGDGVDVASSPAPLVVRLSNLGCAVVGFGPGGDAGADGLDRAEELAEAAQADCRSLASVLASLVFTAMGEGEGEAQRASPAAMRRLFLDIFAGDWAAARAYCEEEESWAEACDLLSCEQAPGWNGWALLALLLDVETYSADAPQLTRVAERWLAAVEEAAA